MHLNSDIDVGMKLICKIMAGVGADGDDATFSYENIIHGHHIYKDIWTPRIAEVLSVAVIQLIDTIVLWLPSLELM